MNNIITFSWNLTDHYRYKLYRVIFQYLSCFFLIKKLKFFYTTSFSSVLFCKTTYRSLRYSLVLRIFHCHSEFLFHYIIESIQRQEPLILGLQVTMRLINKTSFDNYLHTHTLDEELLISSHKRMIANFVPNNYFVRNYHSKSLRLRHRVEV